MSKIYNASNAVIANANFYKSTKYHDSCNNHGAKYDNFGLLSYAPWFSKKHKDCIYCQVDGGDDHVFYFFKWLGEKYSSTFDKSIGTFTDLVERYKEFKKEEFKKE